MFRSYISLERNFVMSKWKSRKTLAVERTANDHQRDEKLSRAHTFILRGNEKWNCKKKQKQKWNARCTSTLRADNKVNFHAYAFCLALLLCPFLVYRCVRIRSKWNRKNRITVDIESNIVAECTIFVCRQKNSAFSFHVNFAVLFFSCFWMSFCRCVFPCHSFEPFDLFVVNETNASANASSETPFAMDGDPLSHIWIFWLITASVQCMPNGHLIWHSKWSFFLLTFLLFDKKKKRKNFQPTKTKTKNNSKLLHFFTFISRLEQRITYSSIDAIWSMCSSDDKKNNNK